MAANHNRIVGYGQQDYEILTSKLTIIEPASGNPDCGGTKTRSSSKNPELKNDEEVQELAELLISEVEYLLQQKLMRFMWQWRLDRIDYLLTWNCRHIDNAAKKPIIRSICIGAGYPYPEICTPMELLPEKDEDV